MYSIAVVLAGCASNAPPASESNLINQTAKQLGLPSGENERPAFYLPWKGGDLPGLTQRPALDRASIIPDYPASAQRAGQEGTSTLEACVTVDGRLVDVRLAKSSGYPALDDATLNWAKQAKYKPAMFGQEALAVCGYRLEWVWKVNSDAPSTRPGAGDPVQRNGGRPG